MAFSGRQRTVDEFIKFLEKETELKLSDMFKEKYPEYRKQHKVPQLVETAIRALIHAKPGNPGRFLTQYFTDPDCFAKSDVQGDEYTAAAAEWLEWGVWMEHGLMTALPEKPTEHLSRVFEPPVVTIQVWKGEESRVRWKGDEGRK